MSKYHKAWMKMAVVASSLSKDPNTQVGALIVSEDNRKFSIGYNGFAKGYPDDYSIWEDREEKHKRVIHAEENAIINCPFDTVGCSIYVTFKPCHKCLPRLINAGIKNVYYKNTYQGEKELELVKEYQEYFDNFKMIM